MLGGRGGASGRPTEQIGRWVVTVGGGFLAAKGVCLAISGKGGVWVGVSWSDLGWRQNVARRREQRVRRAGVKRSMWSWGQGGDECLRYAILGFWAARDDRVARARSGGWRRHSRTGSTGQPGGSGGIGLEGGIGGQVIKRGARRFRRGGSGRGGSGARGGWGGGGRGEKEVDVIYKVG